MGLRPTSNHEDPDFPLPLSSTTCAGPSMVPPGFCPARRVSTWRERDEFRGNLLL